ncbi:MAG TPA: DCC1-like thiol-disulfide oxidoreductase family protein [Candidatus Limnocylindrales bacterium]|jgi:predicted DCC family thiol-disulfide oxidoreductase YuxK|nr:DCC1-like thiol-disulfide oxidoreductase family protein [Candidatus Limnocylindrales bacterium]
MVFYDGHCALCHGTVVFVLKQDRSGELFRFAPLQGSKFSEEVAPERRAGLPDSIVVQTNDGALLVRSNAFLHILRRLGGVWKFWAGIVAIFPRGLRDAVYNFIARIRYRVFGTREDLCPVIPPEQRGRFDF